MVVFHLIQAIELTMCGCIATGGEAALVFLVLRMHDVQLKEVSHLFLTQILVRSRSRSGDMVNL